MSMKLVARVNFRSILGTGFLLCGLVNVETGRDRDEVWECRGWLAASAAGVLGGSSDLADKIRPDRFELILGTSLVLDEVDTAGLLLSDLACE